MKVELVPLKRGNVEDYELVRKWKNDALDWAFDKTSIKETDNKIYWDHFLDLHIPENDGNGAFIITADGVKCGMIRITPVKEDTNMVWDLAIVVAKEWRDKGIGTKALKLVPEGKVIVWADNVRAIKAYQKAGFVTKRFMMYKEKK